MVTPAPLHSMKQDESVFGGFVRIVFWPWTNRCPWKVKLSSRKPPPDLETLEDARHVVDQEIGRASSSVSKSGGGLRDLETLEDARPISWSTTCRRLIGQL